MGRIVVLLARNDTAAGATCSCGHPTVPRHKSRPVRSVADRYHSAACPGSSSALQVRSRRLAHTTERSGRKRGLRRRDVRQSGAGRPRFPGSLGRQPAPLTSAAPQHAFYPSPPPADEDWDRHQGLIVIGSRREVTPVVRRLRARPILTSAADGFVRVATATASAPEKRSSHPRCGPIGTRRSHTSTGSVTIVRPRRVVGDPCQYPQAVLTTSCQGAVRRRRIVLPRGVKP